MPLPARAVASLFSPCWSGDRFLGKGDLLFVRLAAGRGEAERPFLALVSGDRFLEVEERWPAGLAPLPGERALDWYPVGKGLLLCLPLLNGDRFRKERGDRLLLRPTSFGGDRVLRGEEGTGLFRGPLWGDRCLGLREYGDLLLVPLDRRGGERCPGPLECGDLLLFLVLGGRVVRYLGGERGDLLLLLSRRGEWYGGKFVSGDLLLASL